MIYTTGGLYGYEDLSEKKNEIFFTHIWINTLHSWRK